MIAGIRYGPIEARIDRKQGTNLWLSFALKEGKNREIKRVCEHLGLQVNRLIRISFGPFQLGDLAKGDVEEVPARILRDQLGGLIEAKRRA
jgi:23S rRNA pseudouridine2605 synthase